MITRSSSPKRKQTGEYSSAPVAMRITPCLTAARDAAVELRREIPHEPRGFVDTGTEVHRNLGMGLQLGHGPPEMVLPIVPVESASDMVQIAAELRFFLDEMHREALFGQRKGRGHAGDAAADDQRCLRDVHPAELKGIEQLRFAHAPTHQILGFARGGIGILPMHPRTLLANVRHFKQELVQPRLAHRLLEQRLVCPGAYTKRQSPC